MVMVKGTFCSGRNRFGRRHTRATPLTSAIISRCCGTTRNEWSCRPILVLLVIPGRRRERGSRGTQPGGLACLPRYGAVGIREEAAGSAAVASFLRRAGVRGPGG